MTLQGRHPQAYARRQLPGPVRREDAVPLISEEPHQLDTDQGSLGLCAGSHRIDSKVRIWMNTLDYLQLYRENWIMSKDTESF